MATVPAVVSPFLEGGATRSARRVLPDIRCRSDESSPRLAGSLGVLPSLPLAVGRKPLDCTFDTIGGVEQIRIVERLVGKVGGCIFRRRVGVLHQVALCMRLSRRGGEGDVAQHVGSIDLTLAQDQSVKAQTD